MQALQQAGHSLTSGPDQLQAEAEGLSPRIEGAEGSVAVLRADVNALQQRPQVPGVCASADFTVALLGLATRFEARMDSMKVSMAARMKDSMDSMEGRMGASMNSMMASMDASMKASMDASIKASEHRLKKSMQTALKQESAKIIADLSGKMRDTVWQLARVFNANAGEDTELMVLPFVSQPPSAECPRTKVAASAMVPEEVGLMWSASSAAAGLHNKAPWQPCLVH